MATATLVYQGSLRTSCTHVRSGNSILTDAPVDNHGNGEFFSPTDLVATALMSCMVTVMGIEAQSKGWDIGNIDAEATKIMAINPRRVSEINIAIRFSGVVFSPEQKAKLEETALNCPVAKSLHPDIRQQINFVYY